MRAGSEVIALTTRLRWSISTVSLVDCGSRLCALLMLVQGANRLAAWPDCALVERIMKYPIQPTYLR